MARVGDRGGVVGVDGSENCNHLMVRGGGSGSGTEWIVGRRSSRREL